MAPSRFFDDGVIVLPPMAFDKPELLCCRRRGRDTAMRQSPKSADLAGSSANRSDFGIVD
jgi:hypothetical protein